MAKPILEGRRALAVVIALGLLAGERCAPMSEAVGALRLTSPYGHVFLVRVSRSDTSGALQQDKDGKTSYPLDPTADRTAAA